MRPIPLSDVQFLSQGDHLLGLPAAFVADPLETTGFALPHLQAALLRRMPVGFIVRVQQAGKTILTAALRPRTGFFDSWDTALSPSCVPAIASGAADEAVRGLLDGTKAPILMKQLPVEGAAFGLFKKHAAHFKVMATWERACLKTDGTFDQWMSENFDHKRRKELKRLRARLSEQGQLETQRLSSAQELPSFIADFLRLEAAGWKGGAGTALAQDPALAEALKEALTAAFAGGQLRFWRITFNGQAIAALFAFVERGTATLGKIAHDESFAKSSPGVMIILDATADFFADPGIHLADSNAIPGHPMIDRIWRGRLVMANVLAASAQVPALKFQAVAGLIATRAALRKQLKTMYYRVKKVKAS